MVLWIKQSGPTGAREMAARGLGSTSPEYQTRRGEGGMVGIGRQVRDPKGETDNGQSAGGYEGGWVLRGSGGNASGMGGAAEPETAWSTELEVDQVRRTEGGNDRDLADEHIWSTAWRRHRRWKKGNGSSMRVFRGNCAGERWSG